MGAAAFEESLKLVKAVNSRNDFESYVPRHGISLNFLLEHLADAKLEGEPVKDMYGIEKYVVKQTLRWECSFTELLKAHPNHNHAVKEKAEYFVSFAYFTDFETLLDALDRFRKKKRDEEDLFVWNSIFTLNQHFGRTHDENFVAKVVYPKGWFKNAFQECIPSIGNMLFLMSPLKKPVALERLWCIYELCLAILDENCTLDVILSEEDEQELIDNLLVSSQSVLNYINRVKAESASSLNPDQEKKLRMQIEQFPRSYAAIDEGIRDRLREWFAHAATKYIADHKEAYKEENMDKYIELLGMVAKMLAESGRVDAAFPLETERLEECKKLHGDEHAKTATAMNNLAQLLRNQGRFTKAEALFREALAIDRKVHGDEHSNVGVCLNNLANLLKDKGDYAKAEELMREALEISEKAYGREHEDFALKLNNLAHLLRLQGKLNDAEPMLREVLRIDEQVLEEDHPDYAMDLNNLGVLLSDQGKHAEAMPLLQESLRIRRKAFGNEHPQVAESLSNIAGVLSDQGEFEEAEKLMKEALRIDAKVLGKEHLDYAMDLNNYADILSDQGKREDAKPLYEEALRIRRKVLGNDHIDVAESLINLAALLSELENFGETSELFEEALKIRIGALGESHPDVANTYWDWADCLRRQELIAEAKSKWEEACRIYKETLGEVHRVYQLCIEWWRNSGE